MSKSSRKKRRVSPEKVKSGDGSDRSLKKENNQPPIRLKNDLSISPQYPRLWAGLVLLILLVFGIYKAWALYGAFPIPNPDFPGFIGIGKKLLSFQMPTDFKRAPVVGILQVLLSKLLDTDSPELSAGWLLNAILSVANLLLLWQLAKDIIGKAAPFVAVVAMLNPWVLRSQINPIAETTMLFFIFSTFLLIFRRSRWAYVFAAIAALVRYECAALIAITFLMDVILHKDKRARLLSILYAALASMPFLLWMLATCLAWGEGTGGNKSHYLKHYGHGMVGMAFVRMLWESAFGVLTVWPKYIQSMFQAKSLMLLNQWCAGIFISISLVYAVWKRQWKVLILVLFFVLYLVVHVMRKNSHHRYCVPVSWIPQLVAWGGIYVVWKVLGSFQKIPSVVKWIIQGSILIAGLIWVVQLYPALAKIAPSYRKGQWLAHAGMLTATLLFAASFIRFQKKHILPLLVVAMVSCTMVISQQFTSAKIIDNGSYYIEFKLLSDWYKKNSQPGEKLASRWAGTLRLIHSKRSDDYVHSNRKLKADTIEEFIEKCYENDVVYVTACPRGSRGTKKGLKNVFRVLNKRENYGPLQYLGTIKVSERYWINIFKLHPGKPSLIQVPNDMKSRNQSGKKND